MKLHKLRIRTWLAAGFVAVLAACQTAPVGQQLDKAASDRIIEQARTRYYNLGDAGLTSFHCRIRPDWGRLFAQKRNVDPKAAAWAMHKLNQIDFELAVRADGTVSVTHNELKAGNEKVRKALAMIYGGMAEMSKGFFTVWGTFMYSTPFPPPGYDYRLVRDGTGYKLSFESGGSSIVETLDKNGVIKRFDETSQGLTVKMQILFTRSPKGLLFAGYDSTYDSPATHESGEVHTRLSYQKVNGFWLPKQLTAKGSTSDGSTFDFTSAFDRYHTARK